MWASMESDMSVFTKSNDEGVERVLKGKRLYAYLMESTVLEYIVERDCNLTQIGGWLDYKTYGIAMPFSKTIIGSRRIYIISQISLIDSPYRKQISGAVLKLGEAGTLTELKRKWWKEMHGGGKCTKETAASSDTAELDIESVGGVFLVLGLGLVCAFCIGLVEFLWNVKTVAVDEKVDCCFHVSYKFLRIYSFLSAYPYGGSKSGNFIRPTILDIHQTCTRFIRRF